jgi:hypothetical protein
MYRILGSKPAPEEYTPLTNADVRGQLTVGQKVSGWLSWALKENNNSNPKENMSALDRRLNTVRGFLSDTFQFPPSTLVKLARIGKVRPDTAVGFRNDTTDIRMDLEEAYNTNKRSREEDEEDPAIDKYATMNWDVHRNAYFQRALHKASSNSVNTWIEIGPGGSAYLTRMVLCVSPNNTIYAIEGAPTSAENARKSLKDAGFLPQRYHVKTGFAGAVALPPRVVFNGFVAEILGHVASNEGYVNILHQCSRAYPALRENISVIVPRVFGTKIVPVSLTKNFQVSQINPKMALFQHFSVPDNQLTDQHVTAEMYDALYELKNGPQRPEDHPYVFRGECEIQREGPLDGFVLYTVFGDSEDALESVAVHNDTSNWSMVFLPLPATEWDGVVKVGDKLQYECRMYVGKIQPNYEISVQCVQCHGTLDVTFEFDYHDIVTPTFTIDAIDSCNLVTGNLEECRLVYLREGAMPEGKKRRRK